MAKPREPMAEALGHLARRARTTSEMRSFLGRKGHAQPVIDQVVSRLTEMGYLNDRDYAERYVASCRSKPRGRIRITTDLTSRGVPREVIEMALEAAFTPEEETEALNRALAKAVSQAPGGLDSTGRRRVASRLLRKGFAPGPVMRAIAAIGMDTPGGANHRLRRSEGDDEL